MARARVARFAGVLRRVADHLDPPPAARADEQEKLVWRSREETRRIQRELLQMIEDWTHLARVDGRHADGLLWIPNDVLSSIVYFIGHEIETRERDFDSIERDPRAVLR